MQIAYPVRLSLLAVLLMGLFSEIMFYNMLGTNCTAFIIAALVTQWRAAMLRDADFIELWANFFTNLHFDWANKNNSLFYQLFFNTRLIFLASADRHDGIIISSLLCCSCFGVICYV